MANSSGDPPALMACPVCKAPQGVVYSAGTVLHKPDMIRVGVRCGVCGHEWQIDRRGDDPLKARLE